MLITLFPITPYHGLRLTEAFFNVFYRIHYHLRNHVIRTALPVMYFNYALCNSITSAHYFNGFNNLILFRLKLTMFLSVSYIPLLKFQV
jgi:hypothetical protein